MLNDDGLILGIDQTTSIYWDPKVCDVTGEALKNSKIICLN